MFLGNPRLSKPEQARARAAFDRAQRVLVEMDAGTSDPDEDTADEDTGQETDHDR